MFSCIIGNNSKTKNKKVNEKKKIKKLPENCLYPPKILCFHHFTIFPAIL